MKELYNQFLNSSKHMQNVYVIVFIVALSLVRITLCIFTADSHPSLSEYASQNLLPEITGMVVELFVILFIIDAIQKSERTRQEELIKSKARDKQINLERRLRAQLRFLIRRIFHDVELNDGFNIQSFLFHASDHYDNQEKLKLLKEILPEEVEVESFIENLLVSCESELPLLLALSPVCVQLSDSHMKAWMSILYYLNQIISKNNLQNNSKRLIDWIALFDKHTYKQNLLKSI